MREDGRGTSIWDTFSAVPGAIREGHTGAVACEQYHRFEEDARLMAELGVGAYRFSVAWPRIQPDGRGRANARGLDHYRRLVDALNRRGIAPVATLYHWDLPQALEDAGGWPNRDTASRFAEYAGIVTGALAGEVSSWITVNEPWVAAWLGYGAGIHAPGRRDTAAAVSAAHHLLLGHGYAMETSSGTDDVGISLNLEPHEPDENDPADERATHLADQQMNAWFLDPLFGRGYPTDLYEHLADRVDMGFVRDGDLATIAQPLGFLGVNYYRRQRITSDANHPHAVGEVPGGLGAWTVVRPDQPVTSMGWPVDASGLTEVLVGVHREYEPSRIVLTENGAAFDDVVAADGTVDDGRRVEFLRAHVEAAHDALEAGVPLRGFFVWSILDNFEWAEGYTKRFGLVYVDYETQRRIPKASATWFAERAAGGPP